MLPKHMARVRFPPLAPASVFRLSILRNVEGVLKYKLMMILTKDKNIYLKKIDKIGDYEVWLVDGSYIRKVVNENFVEYDYHFNHDFIPKNEFWIDEQTNHDEWKFFIDRMFMEQGLIRTGEKNKEAFERGALLEKKERKDDIKNQHLKILVRNRSELLTKIKKKILNGYSGKVKVWLVDGKIVRDFLLVDYAGGGHDKVYTFIPKDEIWIDEVLHHKEIKFIVLHELSERRFMSQGIKYSEAHKRATLIEDYYRDHESEIEVRIKEELKKK